MVWRFALFERPDDRALLGDDERLRVASLRNPADQSAYAAARAGLRRILGGACGQRPQDVMLGYTPQRKPVLVWPPQTGLEIGIAHTGQTALVALSRAGPVGVDIERPDPAMPVLDIARAEFDPREVAWLEGLADDARLHAFTRLWVRKEAVGKRLGHGLWPGLREPLARDGDMGEWQDLPSMEGEIAALSLARAAPVTCRTCQLA